MLLAELPKKMKYLLLLLRLPFLKPSIIRIRHLPNSIRNLS
jgi:hypothetical protein